jgi:hypothetical protein
MVPAEGVEPTHSYEYQILSLARLPIPPRRQGTEPEYKRTIIEVNPLCDRHRCAAPSRCATEWHFVVRASATLAIRWRHRILEARADYQSATQQSATLYSYVGSVTGHGLAAWFAGMR